MRDQFGLKPKQQNLMYRTPYPAAYDQLSFPHKYKLPDFTNFSRQGGLHSRKHQQIHHAVWRSSLERRIEVAIVLYVSIWIGLYMVHDIASQLHYILGRSGETIPPVLLFWYRGDEADRFDQLEAKE